MIPEWEDVYQLRIIARNVARKSFTVLELLRMRVEAPVDWENGTVEMRKHIRETGGQNLCNEEEVRAREYIRNVWGQDNVRLPRVRFREGD